MKRTAVKHICEQDPNCVISVQEPDPGGGPGGGGPDLAAVERRGQQEAVPHHHQPARGARRLHQNLGDSGYLQRWTPQLDI